MAKKKKQAKPKAKKTVKRTAVKHELVVRVQPQAALPALIPTSTELAEPLTSKGGKLTIPKTWLSGPQILKMVDKTPAQFIYQRPGKGGGKWDYVTVSYVQRVLDYVFGFNWDFEIVEHGKEADHVWVRGRLTVHNPDGTKSIRKEQFGRSEVKHKSGTKELLDYGNDLKAASSDALKKCASMLGIARDIYGKTDYKAESGKTPRETETVIQTLAPAAAVAKAVETIQKKNVATEICKGPNGKGCQYGNDVEPLQFDIANYSIKIFGKPLCRDCQKDAKPLPKK